MEDILKKNKKCFEFVICNRINLLFLHLCVKSKLEEQWGHKVLTVMSIEFALRFLVSLQLCSDRSTDILKSAIMKYFLYKNVFYLYSACKIT